MSTAWLETPGLREPLPSYADEQYPVCETRDGCITCGDVAVELVVERIDGADAHCRDEGGRTEVVATELVGDVGAGDRLLVHAGVALERLTGGTASPRCASPRSTATPTSPPSSARRSRS